MAIIITLMIGLLLLAGSSGLMARMLMGRKIGSSESYQQMAETAALNVFNRILATFNKDDDENYKGYYLALITTKGTQTSMAMNSGTGKARMTDLPQPCCKSYALIPVLACQQSGHVPTFKSLLAFHNEMMAKNRFNSSTG